MGEHLIALVAQYGVSIVFVVVMVGQVGVPIPAIGILIGAGAIAADGGMSAPAVYAAAELPAFSTAAPSTVLYTKV
jgi:membrane protein DedA with SNARE-associated domain